MGSRILSDLNLNIVSALRSVNTLKPNMFIYPFSSKKYLFRLVEAGNWKASRRFAKGLIIWISNRLFHA